MAKRRGNNEGSIYKKSDGKWRAQVTVNGQRISFTANTKTECQQWIRETQYHVDQGFTFNGLDIKLKDFLNDWLQTVKGILAIRTHELYTQFVHSEIIPVLGIQKLGNITPDMIQRMYDQKTLMGSSNHAVRNVHKTLNVAFGHAVKMGLIIRNPCEGTIPPKLKQKEMSFFDENQVQQLLNTALKIEDQYYPVYFLAIHTGMRQAELLGLKWEDVDFSRRTLQVKRQCVRPKGGGFVFTQPKSKSGRRTIALGMQAVEVLKEQQLRIIEVRDEADENWQDYNMVFPTKVGTPILASNLRRGFRKLLKESGLPKIRFHDLRHTAASLMLNNGIPVLVASRRLGHSKPSITLDVYGHMISSMQEEAANLMDELMTPISVENSSLFAPKLHPED